MPLLLVLLLLGGCRNDDNLREISIKSMACGYAAGQLGVDAERTIDHCLALSLKEKN